MAKVKFRIHREYHDPVDIDAWQREESVYRRHANERVEQIGLILAGVGGCAVIVFVFLLMVRVLFG